MIKPTRLLIGTHHQLYWRLDTNPAREAGYKRYIICYYYPYAIQHPPTLSPRPQYFDSWTSHPGQARAQQGTRHWPGSLYRWASHGLVRSRLSYRATSRSLWHRSQRIRAGRFRSRAWSFVKKCIILTTNCPTHETHQTNPRIPTGWSKEIL